MGGGGLVILPKKRWNVWNPDNLERVRRDEEDYRRKEEAKERKREEMRRQMRYQALIDGKDIDEEQMEREIEKSMQDWDPSIEAEKMRKERLNDDEVGSELRNRKRKLRESQHSDMERALRKGRLSEIKVHSEDSQSHRRNPQSSSLSSSSSASTKKGKRIEDYARDIEDTRLAKSSIERRRLRDQPWHSATDCRAKRRKLMEHGFRDKKRSTDDLKRRLDKKKRMEDPLSAMESLLESAEKAAALAADGNRTSERKSRKKKEKKERSEKKKKIKEKKHNQKSKSNHHSTASSKRR